MFNGAAWFSQYNTWNLIRHSNKINRGINQESHGKSYDNYDGYMISRQQIQNYNENQKSISDEKNER